MSAQIPKSERVVVVIEEATGKRVQQLCVEEPYANAEEFWVAIQFDDDTEIYLDLSSRIRFGVHYLGRVDGDLEPITVYPTRFLREGRDAK
jgi:hypothetical protein